MPCRKKIHHAFADNLWKPGLIFEFEKVEAGHGWGKWLNC
jgi:hypothetical protein